MSMLDKIKGRMGSERKMPWINSFSITGDEINKKINSFWRKEVVPGFLFRTFMIIFLFLYGIEIITFNNETTETFKTWWLFKLIGVFLIFISLYLLHNTFSKKVSNEVYVKWTAVLLVAVAFLLMDWLFSHGNALQNLIGTISIAF